MTETTLLSEKLADGFPEQAESDLIYLVDQNNDDRMIKQFLNLVIAKYCDLSVSGRSIIISLSLQLRQIIDLLTTDKSRYFAQARSIVGNNCDCTISGLDVTI